MNKFKLKFLTILFAALLIFSNAPSAAAAGSLYVVTVCRDANAVEILDGETLKSLARIAVGEAPHEAIVSADGRTAYVTNYGTKEKAGNSLSIIDLKTLKETKRVDLGDLTRPHGLQEVNGKIYFTAEAVKSVARFDPFSGKVDWRAKTDQMVSHMLAVSADGKRIYTANMLSASVTAIDAGGAESKIIQIPVGKEPEGIALSPDGKTLWIGHRAAGLISIIDTATNKVTGTLTAGQMPLRIGFAPDGKRVYAVSPQEGAVVVFDAATRKEIGRIAINGAPVGLVVAPDSRRVFVTDLKNGKVLSLDAQKLSVTGSAAITTLSDGIGLGFVSQTVTKRN
jgi:YVTN family beta-propeller protein